MKDFQMVEPKWLDLKLQNLGFFSERLLWWCNTVPTNFGDWIGPVIFNKRNNIWPKFAPVYRRPNNAPVYFAAGSIMGSISVPDIAVIWGSGIMAKTVTFSRPREIRAVRGPLTAGRCRELGYDCPDIFGDPGIVLPHYFPKKSGHDYALGIVPHYVDQQKAETLFGNQDDILVIDVTKDVEQVIEDIQRCELLVSSSLHGVLVSHAFERRCAWVSFSDAVAGDGSKFHDYFASVGIFDHQGAMHIDSRTTIADLVHLAKNSPLPDLSGNAEKLLECCPF